jgi:rhamnogalacturonan endolyase
MDTTHGSQQGSGASWLYHYDVVTNGVTNTYANSVDVTATNIGTDFIKITLTCSLPNDPRYGTNDLLYHYYIVRKGYPYITMATWFNVEPDPGQCRFIVRLLPNMLPNTPLPSRNIGWDYGIEGSPDVMGYSMTNSIVSLRGQSRSKHYSNHRQIDWSYIGGVNNLTTMAGVWMVKSNHEGDTGGPFYRCLINQAAEIYETVNYGEGNPELNAQGYAAFRPGTLNGPYTLVFTPGTPPSLPIDTSWLTNGGFNLMGYVSPSQRGIVQGNAVGIPSGFQGVVGFANSKAQYWTTVSNNTYTSPLMIPGTYKEILYKGELEVATNPAVVVNANGSTVANITSLEPKPVALWRIGEWDGSPVGFLNATKSPQGVYPNDLLIDQMHPSDIRLASWTNTACASNPYVIGTSIPSQFPCYQWMGVNGTIVIQFNLTAAQIKNHTVRIGITTSYSGARHSVTVNSYNAGFPGPSTQPSTRTLTVGTYRGINTMETYNIPASAFKVGTNTLYVSLVSGSYTPGATWLSPGIGFDCVEMD